MFVTCVIDFCDEVDVYALFAELIHKWSNGRDFKGVVPLRLPTQFAQARDWIPRYLPPMLMFGVVINGKPPLFTSELLPPHRSIMYINKDPLWVLRLLDVLKYIQCGEIKGQDVSIKMRNIRVILEALSEPIHRLVG